MANAYAKTLKGGEVIGLIGNLGAGKTQFAKGLARGLRIKNRITSPTFVLMKVYKTHNSSAAADTIQNLIHVDAYRLDKNSDISSFGLNEYLGKKNAVVVIEWADRIKKHLPKKTKYIKFKIKDNLRIITF